METIFMNTENSKTNEPHKCLINLLQRLYLKSLKKYIAHQNLSIYYTWKNITQLHKNNKLKMITATWNYEFELPEGSYSVSDIQDYIEYIKETTQRTTHQPSYLYLYKYD